LGHLTTYQFAIAHWQAVNCRLPAVNVCASCHLQYVMGLRRQSVITTRIYIHKHQQTQNRILKRTIWKLWWIWPVSNDEHNDQCSGYKQNKSADSKTHIDNCNTSLS